MNDLTALPFGSAGGRAQVPAFGRATLVLALACAAACAADQGAGPQGKKIEPAFIRENLLAAPPEGLEHVDVKLGDGVVYLGSAIDKPTLIPGQAAKITHYWKVTKPPGPGWRVFTLIRGMPNTADFMNLDATDMEIGHGPATWRAGEIISDPQTFILRPDWHSATATIYVGLIQVDGHQLGDRMAASGPGVVDRAITRELPVDLSKAPPPLGTVYVSRARGPITIDGVANDPGWAGISPSPNFATGEGSPEPVGKASARMTWDDKYLYLSVQVIDNDIYSPYKNHDDPLWKSDVIEIFIDADSNRRGYIELQVNPNNATFDKWWPQTRATPGDTSWESGMITAVKVRGTADKAGDTDQGWDAEIAIPWGAVKGRDDNMKVRLPPEVGDRWRMNVVRGDTRTGGGEASVSSWNRITYNDFHALDRMLTIVFADQTGSIVPKPELPADEGSGSNESAGGGSSASAGSGNAGRGSAGSTAGSGSAATAPRLMTHSMRRLPTTP